MIVHLLSLGRLCTEKSSSGELKVRALIIHFLGDKEIFLLGTNGSSYILGSGISEKSKDTKSLLIESFHGAKERSLLIESLTAV
jgi:hypothetical protein